MKDNWILYGLAVFFAVALSATNLYISGTIHIIVVITDVLVIGLGFLIKLINNK